MPDTMSIQQNKELIFFVTHVEAEDTYLKIWGQVDKNSATCVERMILPLIEHFTRSQGCIGPGAANLSVNALCCARYHNEGYYRAKILNVCPDGMIVLQFIDYGNIEVLPPQEVHLLENIPDSESLQSFPPVAFDFVLMNVLPVNGVWENKIVESIKKTLWYNEYTILIHCTNSTHRFIKLWYNNEDFSEFLINRNLALKATYAEMLRSKGVRHPQMQLYQIPNKRVITNTYAAMAPMQHMNPLRSSESEICGFQQNTPVCCAAQQQHMFENPVPEALVFKSRVLDVGSKHEVYVSFVEDGPHKFSIQLQNTSHILSALMKDINSHPLQPLQEPPLPGSVCLGRYTLDGVLCRAVVMSVMENKCKLYYVDFGHTEVLPYTDIFQLPPHFINPKVLSIRFTLSGVHELNVTDDMKDCFKKIISGTLLVLHVRPPEGPPLVQYGDLYDNGRNIKEILKLAFPSTVAITSLTSPTFGYHEPKKLSKGAEEIVIVSYVESCRKFFVQEESNVKFLELVMSNLADFCAAAPTLNPSQLKIGLPCAALYDNQWYRAQILAVNANNVKVLYVDYGNEETVAPMSLRMICDALVKKLPAQATKCSLNGWELLPCTQEVHNRFELLILEKCLRIKVVDVNPEGIVVDLYEPQQNENIKSQMLRIIGTETTIINEPSDYHVTEHQHSVKIANIQSNQHKVNQSDFWQNKNQSDSWRQSPNSNIQERNKSKNWKNESNEEVQENRNEKSNFYRNDTRSEKFNRDDYSNNKSMKDKWNSRNDYNGGKGIRDGKNRSLGFTPKGHSSEKSWSDKESDTSSKGSGKRGSSGNRSGYSRRGGTSGKVQGNKYSDRDGDGSFRSGRTNGDSYANNRVKDKKSQAYRLAQTKLNSMNSSSEGESFNQRYSPIRKRNKSHIPRPNVTIGIVQNCEIVYTNNVSDFFIQLSPDYTALDTLMANIASVYENGGELMKESEILNDMYCIAQYAEDLRWYRAIIKSVEGNSANVQFVDYGNTERIGFDKIKSIQKEFLQLPIQAIHCKLFGIRNDIPDEDRTKHFECAVTGKTLEAEFITEENGMFSVLLKEVVDGYPTNAFINERFCENIDLLKMKQAAISKQTTTISTKTSNKLDCASSDAKWATISHTPGTKKNVIITWFINPNNFYCHVLDSENEFRNMMNEIQKMYVGREPVASHMLKIGSPVIALFADDKALYRAEIIELNKLNGHLVQYIDFGNSAVVNPKKIYPVEKRLLHLPKQAMLCSLLNIVSQDGLNWSKINTEAIDNCFNADKYECTFHDIKDNKYLVSLVNNGNDVANTIVEKNLALFSSGTDVTNDGKNAVISLISYNAERVDINLLNGQTLRVNVSSVQTTSKFYIQLGSAIECESIINTYMTDKNPEVMQRLSTHEICLGTGCLVYSNGVWRRGVINSRSQSTGFDVKFIDTGAYDDIHSDSVLALPGELAIMQNQAIECSLLNVVSVPEADVALKKHVEGKEVIIYVDEVDNNRLIVKLFDTNGNGINFTGNATEQISPICPMPILNSTHKVSVSFADHSASIWLQRTSERILDTNLVEALNQYYNTSSKEKLVEPKENLVCAAKSADGHWNRAKILKCDENRVYVNFIDYGNCEEITPDMIASLDPRFYTPHQLAINVSLPVTLNGTVSEQLSILQDYLMNRELTAVFHNKNKKWVAELLLNGKKVSDQLRLLNLRSEQETSETGKPQIHNMKVGCTYDVIVSHIDSPSQFWLQHVDDATDLMNMQGSFQVQASTFTQVNEILEEGSLCAAVYTIDDSWYRAQVLDADEDITTVRFIDYGNTDVIDNNSGSIRILPDSWKETSVHSIKCRLDIIPVDSEDWNTAVCEKFENLITSAESIQAFVIANSVPKRVDLLINDKSVSEMLVEEHLAVKIHAEEELIDEIVDLELDPHSAFVSHLNSLNEFWIQEEKSVGDLEVMSDRFIVAHMFPKVEEIKENLLCVAKYPEDNCWYRARVISHTDNATRVIYIDYGNSATSTEIRAIPADVADIPPLSRKCRLVMPEGVTEWSERAYKEFVSLAADGATIFLLEVLKEDDTSLVKLTLDGKNVTEMLANFCEFYPATIEERLPPLGEENVPNVYISRLNSPDDFWIQTESNITDLNVMSDRLQAAPTFLPLNAPEIGTICAAIFLEDGMWYRAKIISQSEDATQVLYIDYGNIAITNEIRMLPVDIISISPLAKHCALKMPDIVDDWPSEACKKFEELAAGGETVFEFEILDNSNDPAYVKLIYNGRNVIDILIPTAETVSQDRIEVTSYENKNVSEESEKTDDIDETRSNVNEEYNADVSASENESPKQKIKEGAGDASPYGSFAVELTVDEIVQSMKKDEGQEDEETIKDHSDTTASHEKDDIDKVGEDVKTQNDVHKNEHNLECTEINVQSSKEHVDSKTVNEEAPSKTSQTEKVILNSKIEIYNNQEDICEPNITTQSETSEENDMLETTTDEQRMEVPEQISTDSQKVTNILSFNNEDKYDVESHLQDTDELNASITESNVKDIEEKVSSHLQLSEIETAKCSDKQDSEDIKQQSNIEENVSSIYFEHHTDTKNIEVFLEKGPAERTDTECEISDEGDSEKNKSQSTIEKNLPSADSEHHSDSTDIGVSTDKMSADIASEECKISDESDSEKNKSQSTIEKNLLSAYFEHHSVSTNIKKVSTEKTTEECKINDKQDSEDSKPQSTLEENIHSIDTEHCSDIADIKNVSMANVPIDISSAECKISEKNDSEDSKSKSSTEKSISNTDSQPSNTKDLKERMCLDIDSATIVEEESNIVDEQNSEDSSEENINTLSSQVYSDVKDTTDQTSVNLQSTENNKR
ncbi:uncharacterized protein LOC108630430 isoform X2 [Ceratina calcarata]|uniref:Uncharacterized protein LOC108630430 isoform X2 n=1 Tax=Ceratina calcarata TaxID=156304 RepID=A0AAJ7WEV4_9HYME|nr:uncharacterized protein LOC108630430 isoform X2 [Ceratina calcarata]